MKIFVEVRNIYGESKAYPACEKAKIFAEIAGTKTLTLATMRQIKRLGYAIEIKTAAHTLNI